MICEWNNVYVLCGGCAIMCSFQGWRVCVVYDIDYKDQIYLIKVFLFWFSTYSIAMRLICLVEFALLLIFHTIRFSFPFVCQQHNFTFGNLSRTIYCWPNKLLFWVWILTANGKFSWGVIMKLQKLIFWDYNLNVCMVLAADSW